MRTVIFDLDGTLVDTKEDITASINHIRAECYSLPPLESRKIVELMNTPGLNLAYEFYGVEIYEEHAKAMFEEHYAKQCLQNAKLFEGIDEVLKRLKSEEIKLFVATNAPTKTSRIILKNNDIEHFFEDVVGADRVVNPKPHPEMLQVILGERKKDLCWMVGDSMKDMIAAKKSGIKGIFAGWGFDVGTASANESDLRANEPVELLRFISV